MPDETAPVHSPQDLQSELDKSRESAERLLENLARKIGASRAVRNAANGMQRAARYVHVHSARDFTAGIERLVRRRPAYAIAVAIAAGFLVGRAARSRR
ncbi:MAG: hypothetical protein LAQ30_01270 [Acidobacteriia bacterium]|nr:hypothetical protein [Terriglobia bacterium]